MIYEILDENGNVINTITASLEFVESAYPGRYREAGNAAEPAQESYRLLTRLEYVRLVMSASSMTPLQFRSWQIDQSPEAEMVRYFLDLQNGHDIDINEQSQMQTIVDGLNVMAALGHTGALSAQEFTSAVIAAWPKVGG